MEKYLMLMENQEDLIAKAIIFLDELDRRFLWSEIDSEDYWYWMDQYRITIDFNTRFIVSGIRINMNKQEMARA